MKKSLFLVGLGLIALFIFPLNDYALNNYDDEIKLYLGENETIAVSNPSRVEIANPEIADVTGVSKQEMTLTPKLAGTTSLVLEDDFGEQSYKVIVFADNVQEVKRRADNLLSRINLPEVYTQAEEEEGKVLLLGRVKTAQDKERISLVLGALKDKITDLVLIKEEEAVIEIDVEVLELDKDATDTLGFTWPGSVTVASDQVAGGTYTGTPIAKLATFFNITNWSRTNFEWKLDLLVQEGKARILSRPRLACQSGKEAELLVGGEKPIFTTAVASTSGASSTNVEYKEYGIKLKIKPTVAEEGRIKLGLNVDVSEVGTAEVIGSASAPTAKAYPLSKRTASTELYLQDGQTMGIGGLIKQKSEEDIRKMPWLGDIPVLGLFFRKRVTKSGGGQGERGNTELFIALTPRIVPNKNETKKLNPAIAISEPQATPQDLRSYASTIQQRILKNLKYPPAAKESGFQGTAKLGLHLAYTGDLLDAVIKSSSGYKVLDDSALEAARGISTYPALPSDEDPRDIWIEVPIVYRLD